MQSSRVRAMRRDVDTIVHIVKLCHLTVEPIASALQVFSRLLGSQALTGDFG